jgi:hypothetical protein
MSKYTMLLVFGLISLSASAMKLDEGDNKNIYFTESGKRIEALDAYKAAMNDQKVLQCSYVEAVGNKRTGKVTLKKKQ